MVNIDGILGPALPCGFGSCVREGEGLAGPAFAFSPSEWPPATAARTTWVRSTSAGTVLAHPRLQPCTNIGSLYSFDFSGQLPILKVRCNVISFCFSSRFDCAADTLLNFASTLTTPQRVWELGDVQRQASSKYHSRALILSVLALLDIVTPISKVSN